MDKIRRRLNTHPTPDIQDGMRAQVNSQPMAARVDGVYYSFVAGDCQTARVNDPSCDTYVPKARFNHSAVLWEDKWYVLGGIQHTPACIEEYDIHREIWRQHKTTGDITDASIGVACAAVDGKLYTLGGCTSDQKFTNTLSELDFETMSWRTLNPAQHHNAPILKRDAAMIAHNRTLVNFGGYGTYLEIMNRKRARYENSGMKSEVWTNELILCDLDQNEWSVPLVSGKPPKPCSECTLTPISRDRAVLLGGIAKKVQHSLDSVKILDMSESKHWSWTTVLCSKPTPPPRYGHCAVSICKLFNNSLLMMWGRNNQQQILSDVWMLHLVDDSKHCHWKQVALPSNFFKPAYNSTAEFVVTSAGKQQLLRFGGYIEGRVFSLDDMYITDIATGDEPISLLDYRLPKPAHEKVAESTVEKTCSLEEAHYMQLKSLSQPQSKELTLSEQDEEIDMSDIGISLSIQPGSIDNQLHLSVHPVTSPAIEMPRNCVSHSPLYIITPFQAQKGVKVTIEHSCNIQSEEDCSNMVFLGVESGPESDGTCKLKEIPDAQSTFRIGDQKCEIVLTDVQPLRVARKVPPPTSPDKKEVDKKMMYSAIWFRSLSESSVPNIAAILTISQLQPAYIKFAKSRVTRNYPELDERVSHQPIHFTSEEARLEISEVEGWDLESDKGSICQDQVDLPDQMDVEDLDDYPPFIKVKAREKLQSPPPAARVSSLLKVVGLSRDCSLKLALKKHNVPPPLQSQSVPVSPSSLLDSISSCSIGNHEEFLLTPPSTPRQYSLDTELTEADLPLLHNLLKDAATEWCNIGLQLGISYSELEKIRRNIVFALSGDDRYLLGMLVKWLRSSKNRKVRSLQLALHNSEFIVLASDLLQQLNSKRCEVVTDVPQATPHENFNDPSESEDYVDIMGFEMINSETIFKNDIEETARKLRDCIQCWKGNDLLNIAERIAGLIEDIEHSLGKSGEILTVISKMKTECKKLTEHDSVKLLATINVSVMGNQLTTTIDLVRSQSHVLESLVTSQLKTSVTEDESMKLLMQNVRNLSNAVQSLLGAAETASLGRHKKDVQESHLSWERVKKNRWSSIPNRKRELEESGLMRSMQEKFTVYTKPS